ncbi:MAG: histidinol-phosphatase [Firmicutes bacterium]|nr:histidinol-phosphatase [Bacillota bacterium]
MKVNLHTHTYRCHHATGADEDYVAAAIAAGYDKLGFADHTPLPYTSGFVNWDKMAPDELKGYLCSIAALRQRYAGQIPIYIGLECEAVERFFPYLRALRPQLDYMILGNHGDKEYEDFFGHMSRRQQLWHYLETAVKGMETGLFLYLAHPDLMLQWYPSFDETAAQVSRALCREAKRLGVPLEYNLAGVSKGAPEGCLGYPCRQFWEIAAQENMQAVVGVDAHSPEALLRADIPAAEQALRQLGIEPLEDPTTLL